MGIRHLQTFQQKNVHSGYYKIDVLHEIQAFKRYHPKPILVIDVMSFLSVHSRNEMEGIFAGRYQVYEKLYHTLFQRLLAAGAELVFFMDGPVQEAKDQVWLNRQNEKYQNCIGILEQIAAQKPASRIISESRNIPNIHLFMGEFESICKQYGRVYVSFYHECDLEIAAFATMNNALAVIADDSDYLIYKGDWRYWSARQLDLNDLTTMEYDRRALWDCLDLSNDQMRIFATVAGNDIVKYEKVQNFHRQLGNIQNKFHNIAHYIRENYWQKELQYRDMQRLSVHLFGRQWTHESIEVIKKSLGSYEFMCVQSRYEPDNLLRYAMDQGKTRMYSLLADITVNITLLFDDLRPSGALSIYDIALPIIRKCMGIILQHKQDPQLVRSICTKRLHNEPYHLEKITPDYPQEKLPPLLEFYSTSKQQNDKYENMRYSLVCWVMNSKRINKNVLTQIPPQYLITIFTLVYLHEQNQMTTHVADLILLSTHDIITQKVPEHLPYPQFFDEQLVKSSFLFLKMLAHIKRGISAISFEKVPKKCYFDGVYLYTLALLAPAILESRLKEISKLRIYAN